MKEAQKINLFKSELKEPTGINFPITEKVIGTSYRPINRLLIPTINPCHNIMVYFKAYFIHPSLESPNILIFHSPIQDTVAEVDKSAAEYMEVEDVVMAVVIEVVANEDVVEGDMVITHMNLPAGMDNFWQKLVYNL